MKKKLVSGITAFIIFLVVAGTHALSGSGSMNAPSADAELYGPYQVERVVDGDTFIANINGENTRIRMIGIDTPESVPENPERITAEGIIAADYAKQLLSEAEVYLEYDEDRYDRYHRVLAYVYMDDGDDLIFVNALLVREGYADLMTIEPDTKYAKLLESEYSEK